MTPMKQNLASSLVSDRNVTKDLVNRFECTWTRRFSNRCVCIGIFHQKSPLVYCVFTKKKQPIRGGTSAARFCVVY